MLIVEYRVGSPLLMAALERASNTTVHSEEQYLTETGEIRWLFWAEGDDRSAFEAGLEDDPTVTGHRLLAESGSRRLYRVSLTDRGRDATTFPLWSEFDVVLLEASATREGWENRMRIPDRETLARYRSALSDRDLKFRLRSLYREADADGTAESQLTDDQHAALVAAYDAGYFDVPRTTSQTDLAATLNVSSQALSERLRRGTATLVRETLLRTRS